jgi:putative SOS response-associated peptidase YedK
MPAAPSLRSSSCRCAILEDSAYAAPRIPKESRCLVPANSFAEYAPEPNTETGKRDVVWIALNNDRPLFAFAGVWTEFRGDCERDR